MITAFELIDRRMVPGAALAAEALILTDACRDLAERFRHGGTLLVFGAGAESTDARHIAVEFVHPAIVGRPALPAMALEPEAGPAAFAQQIHAWADLGDVALALAPDADPAVLAGVRAARDLGLLTIVFTGAEPGELAEVADHLLTVPSTDPLVIKEIHMTAYHVLWEMTHLYLDGLRP